ncbi:hypothetical protein EDM56_09960 [Brevibacillus fluminis]|uniref:Uncharacterized protein n=1 Tax=Brevibacillus fluminis TaxID=511487 RepID=A0A3M8DN49_9BACL|nr:hypothetical protein EDM56_09960 [Brevibacillus fluminis]
MTAGISRSFFMAGGGGFEVTRIPTNVLRVYDLLFAKYAEKNKYCHQQNSAKACSSAVFVVLQGHAFHNSFIGQPYNFY